MSRSRGDGIKVLGSQSVSGSGSGSGGQVAVQSVFTMIDVLTSWRSKANYKSTRQPQREAPREGGKQGTVYSLSPPSGLHPFGTDPNPFGRCVTALLAAVPKGSLGRCYSITCSLIIFPPTSSALPPLPYLLSFSTHPATYPLSDPLTASPYPIVPILTPASPHTELLCESRHMLEPSDTSRCTRERLTVQGRSQTLTLHPS